MTNADYTSTVTHVRVFLEGWALQEPSWAVDGADNDGKFCEPVWTFPTFADAIAAIPEFVEEATSRGVRWDWDANRPKRAREIQHPEGRKS